ncbi:MAG: rod shape-determining protein MreC [Pedosphaera sp.]|nr:rod shape-determining protein MreC [Pedosphaera sp.]
MLKKPHYIAIGGALLLLITLMNLPASVAGRFKRGISVSFLPLFGLRSGASSFLDRVSFQLIPRSALIDELIRTQRENADLQLAHLQNKEILAENLRLRSALAWPSRSPLKKQLAQVIGRDSSTWWRTLRVDLGSRDGIKPNQVVVTADGLVGRISQVGLTHSDVALIGNAECGVAIIIQKSRDQGIIKSGQVVDDTSGQLDVSFLQNSLEVMAGDLVVTSGLGGIFPAGVTVGAILHTRATEGGLFTTARLRLAVHLNRLEEVWILSP